MLVCVYVCVYVRPTLFFKMTDGWSVGRSAEGDLFAVRVGVAFSGDVSDR